MKIPDNWTFKDKGVAEGFDAHVNEQLPWYGMASDLVCHLARSYLQTNSVLVDLACSTGNITSRLEKTIIDRNVLTVSIDSSEEMKDEFRGVGDVTVGDMTDMDLIPNYDVCVVMLGLMFIPVKDRAQFLSSLKHRGNEGSAIIVVDKIIPLSGYVGQTVSRMAMKNKIESGVDPKLILEKELSLSGAQRPSSEFMFVNFGFNKWFQVGDFCGYICEVNT